MTSTRTHTTMKRPTKPEKTAAYLPAGTKARIAAAIGDYSLTESAFIRIAVLDRLTRIETQRRNGVPMTLI